ncbi:unnamed protein product [Durusdinium trenchii]|uniref:Uncharacterized protein n=1 Tax=Durusdinium trenchii TaxID=1381693 RepID=A0ABP0PH30_9DINO
MALVAVRRSRDFPEGRVLGLDCKPLKPCGTPQTRRPRQVAPTGWTMCECEADKEWVLCDRVDAVAAEMAARIQRHLCEETISDLAEVDVMKEATVRLAEIQLEQGNVEEPGAVEEDIVHFCVGFAGCLKKVYNFFGLLFATGPWVVSVPGTDLCNQQSCHGAIGLMG